MSIVLIVEDELIEQEFLKSIIEEQLSQEDKILTCESGLTAIELAKKYRPDIILIDILITELDGLSAIEEIRNFLPEACITIMSAHSNFDYAQKAIALRVNDYLLKPVKPGALKAVFEKMLQTVTSSKSIPVKEPDMKSHIGEEPQYFIEESIKYIKKHFKEKLTLEMVASKVYINPKYLSHVFKKDVGVSFTDYIIQLRIEYACQLLATTNYPAYRISLECGFSDPSYFNRVFCTHMNITPQTYRRQAHMQQ